MFAVAVASGAVPVAIGGALAIGGVIVAIMAARSVVRSDEGSVTTAIVAGGLLAAATLSHGHWPAVATIAGVFIGAELAACGRRLAIDPESPTAPELAITAATIAVGLAAAAAVAVISRWRAAPPLANAALVALLLAGTAALLIHHLRGDAQTEAVVSPRARRR
jgi:hypothetical protein